MGVRALMVRASMVFRRAGVEGEMEEEIRSHLDMAAEDHLRNGMDPEHAQRIARRNFGGIEQTKERYRDLYRFQGVEAFFHDFRFGLHTLRKNPGFTMVAVGMLALGIGINAAVFTEIDAALFKGFPLVERNDRLVQITTANNVLYYPDLGEWRSQAKSFEGIGLIRGIHHTLSDGGATQSYFTTEVTSNTFQLLGVRPFLGRDFAAFDEQPGAAPVLILRYDVWVGRFGANRAIVGKTVRLDGVPTTVIGVMPRGFSFPWSQSLWVPMVPSPAALRRETGYARWAFARLADGATIENARVEMDAIGRRLASEWPRTNQGVVPVVKDFEDWYISANARTLYAALWGAVGFVLLIVCANVANLLVEQAMGRSHEISVRLALGAGRWRIVRQFLVESLMLSILGGVIGWWIADGVERIYPSAQLSNDVVLSFTMDHRVLVYLAAISIAAGLVAGFATAIHLTKPNINSTSKEDSRVTTGGRHGRRLAGVLVGAQVVFAVVLLASAGVMIRSILNVYRADVGVNTRDVLVMALGMAPERYPHPEAWIPFYRDLGERLKAIPGVESAAIAGAAPTDDIRPVPYELADSPVALEHARPTVAWNVVTAGYFQTLGARMMSGRGFDDADRAGSLPVAIVNSQFAESHWPGQSPLGKRLRLYVGGPGRESGTWLTVVGVVSNIVQNDRTRQAFDPLVYLPFGQHPGGGMFVFVRTSVAPDSIGLAARRAVYKMDPDLDVSNVMSLADRLDRGYVLERNVTVLFLVFAVVALLLASVGLYAAVAHSVSRRVREIGIRVALGATNRDILRLVFRQGVIPVGAGLGIGLGVSFAMNRVLQSYLVGVSPADPVALAGASAVLVAAGAMGCWIPARRAMRVDPAVTLKYE